MVHIIPFPDNVEGYEIRSMGCIIDCQDGVLVPVYVFELTFNDFSV